MKVGIVGTYGSGKTSLCQMLAGNRYYDNVVPTIGIDIVRVADTSHKIMIIDTAGQERFQSITSSFLKNIDMMLVTFALDQSFGIQTKAMQIYVDMLNKDNMTVTIVLVVTKSDINKYKRQFEVSDVHELARNRGYLCVECCAKKNNISQVRNLIIGHAEIRQNCDDAVNQIKSPKLILQSSSPNRRCC
jgi:small GTP-binding protein